MDERTARRVGRVGCGHAVPARRGRRAGTSRSSTLRPRAHSSRGSTAWGTAGKPLHAASRRGRLRSCASARPRTSSASSSAAMPALRGHARGGDQPGVRLPSSRGRADVARCRQRRRPRASAACPGATRAQGLARAGAGRARPRPSPHRTGVPLWRWLARRRARPGHRRDRLSPRSTRSTSPARARRSAERILADSGKPSDDALVVTVSLPRGEAVSMDPGRGSRAVPCGLHGCPPLAYLLDRSETFAAHRLRARARCRGPAA